jgi:ubiquinone/menaquinone biosynthesis C-methylase UbiE
MRTDPKESHSVRETDRIADVYRAYDASVEVQARRDPLNRGNIRIAKERFRGITGLLGACGLLPLTGKRILDVGCGSGSVLASLVGLGAEARDLYGIDLLADRVETAHRMWPGMTFRCGNAERLDFPDNSFDLVLLFTVFSSIASDDVAHKVAGEVTRILRTGGALLWYDMRYSNPQNPHIRGITRRHLRAFFPDWSTALRSMTLLPPLARRLGPLTAALYPVLAAIPPLRTHYLGVLVKPGGKESIHRIPKA